MDTQIITLINTMLKVHIFIDVICYFHVFWKPFALIYKNDYEYYALKHLYDIFWDHFAQINWIFLVAIFIVFWSAQFSKYFSLTKRK